MNDAVTLREFLMEYCFRFIEEQIGHVQNAINLAQESAQNEQKSSAGDKHETGKSLMQLEQENHSIHLQKMQSMQRVVPFLQSYIPGGVVKLGSIVETTAGIYYLALGIGRISYTNIDVFIISPSSPIGKLLLEKKAGDVVKFQDRMITINKVS
jgi:transcription elongation GreA/GreB family factor